MDVPSQLQHDGAWRIAVWSLRVGYVGLMVALTGLAVVLSGSTPWILAVGMGIWLVSVAVTLSAFLRARHDLADARPRLWSMRLLLIHDSVHAKASVPAA